eukprot:gene23040-biopygen17779
MSLPECPKRAFLTYFRKNTNKYTWTWASGSPPAGGVFGLPRLVEGGMGGAVRGGGWSGISGFLGHIPARKSAPRAARPPPPGARPGRAEGADGTGGSQLITSGCKGPGKSGVRATIRTPRGARSGSANDTDGLRETPKIHRKSQENMIFANFAARSSQSEPAGSRTHFPLRSGVSEFSELSGRISQELDFWGVPGQGLVPWPGGWWCLAGTQASAGSKRSPWRLHPWGGFQNAVPDSFDQKRRAVFVAWRDVAWRGCFVAWRGVAHGFSMSPGCDNSEVSSQFSATIPAAAPGIFLENGGFPPGPAALHPSSR